MFNSPSRKERLSKTMEMSGSQTLVCRLSHAFICYTCTCTVQPEVRSIRTSNQIFPGKLISWLLVKLGNEDTGYEGESPPFGLLCTRSLLRFAFNLHCAQIRIREGYDPLTSTLICLSAVLALIYTVRFLYFPSLISKCAFPCIPCFKAVPL